MVVACGRGFYVACVNVSQERELYKLGLIRGEEDFIPGDTWYSKLIG